MRKNLIKFTLLFMLLIAGIAGDMASKRWAIENLKDKPPLTAIDGYLEFSYTENRGMVFGLLNDRESAFKHYGLTILTVLATGFVVFIIWRIRQKSFLFHLPFFLILSGAVANLYERIFHGHVVDFIHMHWRDILDWPFLFNGADVLITIGELLLLLLIILRKDVLEEAVFQGIQIKKNDIKKTA